MKTVNGKLIENICNQNKDKATDIQMRVQVGGGIRTIDHIAKLIDVGVDRVVLGTIAVRNLKF